MHFSVLCFAILDYALKLAHHRPLLTRTAFSDSPPQKRENNKSIKSTFLSFENPPWRSRLVSENRFLDLLFHWEVRNPDFKIHIPIPIKCTLNTRIGVPNPLDTGLRLLTPMFWTMTRILKNTGRDMDTNYKFLPLNNDFLAFWLAPSTMNLSYILKLTK